MNKSIREQFIDFRGRNNLSLSNIREIVEDYANSNFEFARSHFCEKYEISEYVFYKCRDFAVVFGLVSDKTCRCLQIKASHNSSAHNTSESCRRSLQHFDKLFQQRKEVLNSFTKEEKLTIGKEYSTGISIANIAKFHGIGIFLVKKLLEKGIVDSSIDDETLKDILKYLSTNKKNKKYLDNLLLNRKKYRLKKPILQFSNTLQQALPFLIQNYDIYFVNAKEPPSTDELKVLLEIVKEQYVEVSQL